MPRDEWQTGDNSQILKIQTKMFIIAKSAYWRYLKPLEHSLELMSSSPKVEMMLSEEGLRDDERSRGFNSKIVVSYDVHLVEGDAFTWNIRPWLVRNNMLVKIRTVCNMATLVVVSVDWERSQKTQETNGRRPISPWKLTKWINICSKWNLLEIFRKGPSSPFPNKKASLLVRDVVSKKWKIEFLW